MKRLQILLGVEVRIFSWYSIAIALSSLIFLTNDEYLLILLSCQRSVTLGMAYYM